jgi:2-oxoglutarate ferredoxin oxidoreductase subunit beta
MIRACHSGENLTAVYINGFIYHTLCLHKKSRNSFREEFNGFSSDVMFNLPYLAFRSGASVVARWTPLHCRRLASSLHAGLTNPGFSFVEVVSPCLMYFAGTENETITLDRMAPYGNNARINHNAAWADLEIHDIRSFIIGHFTEKNDS